MKSNITVTKSIITVSLSVLLVSCGGGGSTSTTTSINQPTGINPTNSASVSGNNSQISDEPLEISSSNWRLSRALSRGVATTATNYSPGNHTWKVTVKDDSNSADDHLQVYLNIDNDHTTGYKFDNEAWANKSGVDYLIEDNVLFKSTANDSSWSWEYIAPVVITRNQDLVEITVPVSRLAGLCNNFTIGTIGMSSTWGIESFYPLSNDMAVQTIDYCDGSITNNQPVITASSSAPIMIGLNDNFSIPAVSAYDAEDGDISNKIESVSNVNSSVTGSYQITYTVSDSQNLAAIPLVRSVIVQDTSASLVIDGSSDDWSRIDSLSQTNGSTLKVTDDAHNIYVLVDSTNLGSNTQVLINSDNKSTTGTLVHGNGIDYMVENSLLSKNNGANAFQWAWEYGFISIPFVKNQNMLEMSIPKSSIANLADTIEIGFKSLDENWVINYSIPEISDTKIYTLNASTTNNSAPTANNDNVSTSNTSSVTIDAIDNDTDPDGDQLTITNLSSPSKGTAVRVGNEIKYTPNNGASGTDTFTYTINDGNGHTASATVTVSISVSNRAPTAVNDSATTNNISSVTIDVIDNDFDPDSDQLTISSVSSPSKGTAVGISNKIKYTPNSGTSGTDSFTYTINDGNGHTASATVTVNVASINRPPVAVEDAPQTEFNTPIEIKVLENDSDPDGDTLSILSFTQPTLGSVTKLNNTTLLFDPEGNVASISFLYVVSDGRGGTTTGGVTVASHDPNDPDHAQFPNITGENITISAGQTILIDVLDNDFDPDGDTLNLDQVDDPIHGTTVKINGKVQYTPDPGFTGIDEFYYGVHDGYGHNGAGLVTITVQ